MAKRETRTRVPRENGAASPAIPSGYKKRTNEVTGFWEPNSTPIHFVPRSARVFDNKTEPLKYSILIQGESVGINSVITKDGEVLEAQNGDIIGVWYKPGMVAIKDLRNVPVYMYADGERDTGKPNPMQLFEVLSAKIGDNMVIDTDYRKRSLHTILPFDIKVKGPRVSDDQGDEDPPPF